jgi:hypothetical protein
MNTRWTEVSDLPRLKELHERSGLDYKFPNLDEFFPVPSIVDDDNRPVITVASMPTVELFFFVDSEWETPGIRMEAFKSIHEFVRIDLHSRGVVEANAWVPPQMAKPFGRRLMKMGWDHPRAGWTCYSRRTDHGTS